MKLMITLAIILDNVEPIKSQINNELKQFSYDE